MPLPFNKNLDLKLLKLVKENPILYNTKHSKYLDFDSREVVWQKIGDALNRPALVCKSRWINIRDMMRRKVRDRLRNPNAYSYKYKYEDEISFMMPYFRESSSTSTTAEEYPEFLDEPSEIEMPSEVYVDETLDFEEPRETKPVFRKRQTDEASANSSRDFSDQMFQELNPADPLDVFLLTIGSTLRKFSPYYLNQAKSKIFQEKQKDKKKLVPRLLGINSHAILRLDEVTKEILQEWPLTHVKTYHAGKSQTFTLNFGDYSDKEYSVKTQDCHRIRDILEGYIDIIRRSQPQSGTMITTVQQLVVTDHLQNQQMALAIYQLVYPIKLTVNCGFLKKGEMPLRSDMSKDCIKKLNKMNSNSVKIVGLLTDPTEHDYEEIQKIVRAMKEDFPDIDKAKPKTKHDNEAVNDLLLFFDQDREGAKDAAENIADLTTQVYFSLDPKTRRRSELIRRSRNKMKAGEKSEQSMRRASFLAAANSAQHALDSAVETLNEDYTGPKPDAAQRMQLEKALEDKMGKLNAAIALYLTAHSDPENIDYASAINSMNAINELMPEIAKDTQILASTLEPSSREQLLDDMQELCDATRAIIELAKDVGAKTSLLLVSTNELTCQAASEPAAADVDTAGVRVAEAATDLIACAQLTAPAIHEPHCQSALTAACEGIGSSVHQLETAWRPLLEDQTRQPMNDQLHSRVVDVGKALERLKDAYANLGGVDDDDSSLPAQERKRLKFIATMNGAKGRLQGVEDLWNQQSATGVPSDAEKAEAQRRMEQSMAQLNAAIAALAAATADAETVSSDKDEATRNAMQKNIRALCDATRKICEGDGYKHVRIVISFTLKLAILVLVVEGEEAANFAAASGKLLFLISPGADKGRQKFLLGSADSLTAVCQLQAHEQPELQAQCAVLTDTHQQLADSLHRLTDACNVGQAALGQKLNDRIAQLNAAVAALAAATSDRENPDYEAAERAVNTISQIMPHLIQDSQMLCGTKSDAEQAAMLQELRALCEATQELYASTKLVYCATPRADNEMENEILGLTTDACGKASELLSQVQHLTERVTDAGAAAELDRCGASAADAAQALLTVAQATASTMDSPCCKDQLISSAQKLRRCADELTSSCEPHTAQLPDARRQLGTAHRQLADSLDKLMQACQKIPEGSQSGVSQPPKEKQRLKFMNSLTGARNRLYDAEQQLKQPLPKHQLSPEQAAALEQRLSQRLAQLNAAVAALAAAKADPENPDWKTAEQSVKEISELMALIVQDSRQLSSTKDGAGQAAMLDDLKALCHASRSLCENSETDPKISTKEFHKAASKLKFIVSPTADKIKEKQAACKQAERLAVNAQTACPAQAPLASRLHEAAGTLDSVVQATSASPSDPRCCAAVNSSVNNVRHCAQQLTSSCEPPLMTRPEAWQQLLSCTIGTGSGQQEQQRLKFINSASGAKGRLNATEQLLKEPLVCQLLKEEDGAALQRRLGARVAQLNAAVAALTAATADREHPDYAAADQAIQHIAQLMPQVVQESRTLCGTKSDAEQAAMLQELRALCEATQELCEHAGQAQVGGALGGYFYWASVRTSVTNVFSLLQGVSDAAAKFSAASGKLVYVVSPKTQDAHEKQVLALAATSCGKASELLSQVQQLTERVTDAGAAAELDRCGASAADAAQALLTVAQTTAPTISDPQCQKQVISSAQKLRRCADGLIATCEPHTAQDPKARQQIGASHRQLDDSLDQLVQACGSVPHGAASSGQQEQQRLKFINTASGAKGRLNATEQLLKEPLVCQLLKEEDGAALQRRLGARVAQLNAAVAALTAATADREHPDYAAADQAIQHIAQLMPQVVQESRTLCGTKSDAEQAAMLQELRALCEATQELCEHAGQAQGVSDAAAKFSAASGKLVYVVSPKTQDAHEKQVLALAATSCGKASELLSQVQQLTERVADADAAAELDRCGASAADAAQALLTVAQRPSVSEAADLIRAEAPSLRGRADVVVRASHSSAPGRTPPARHRAPTAC
ncbi:unnamed protein product [Spodoptera littoralis]|uniref:MADF domain-containing protein n=1 Tax=Spodoptera littoralis TaxID=7109 RepID=A0A9P0I9C0_SPOLI|nr:unnamed protein product [Spodoptera littoralis]CAH1643822.1 unnamed protein product [Spodoptera littoralis]